MYCLFTAKFCSLQIVCGTDRAFHRSYIKVATSRTIFNELAHIACNITVDDDQNVYDSGDGWNDGSDVDTTNSSDDSLAIDSEQQPDADDAKAGTEGRVRSCAATSAGAS